jgi:DNA modification methylase
METLEKSEFYLLPSYLKNLFGRDIDLLSSVDELFELELAYLEYNSVPENELLERLAYFKCIDKKLTKHFLMYNRPVAALVNDRSATTKSYFENGLFSTGYATHGLFPYRGKFHPQLIKSLLNIIGIRKGEVILDPMCGSGTANVEAALMGINSYALDLSPFCQLMTRVKYNSLFFDPKVLKGISNRSNEMFDFFAATDLKERFSKIIDKEKKQIYEFALLAFLDALGYSTRVVSSTHRQLFSKVLWRYEATIIDFLEHNSQYLEGLGELTVLNEGMATKIPLESNTVDGVITSPPYSFAIDYVKNDEAQLRFLGYNIENIRNRMIGLAGKNKEERLENYFKDMKVVCSEISRVLKPDKFLVMIIGSNTNQTGGIRLEEAIIDSCGQCGLKLVKTILKPIKGMRNTMKDELVLFLKKGITQ